MTIVFLVNCSPLPSRNAKGGLGVSVKAIISESQLNSIRSFRILAFDQSTYKCNALAHRINYGRVGYISSLAFDWNSKNKKLPKHRLYLPSKAFDKTWVVQVEAFNVTRSSQTNARPIAQGCSANIQFFDEDIPTQANVELHSSN